MSRLGGYKPKTSEEDLREARRKKLEADRLQRAQQRTQHRNQLEATLKAQREADEAVKNLLEIDPSIFEKEDKISIADSEVSELLLDTEPVDKWLTLTLKMALMEPQHCLTLSPWVAPSTKKI